MGLAAPKNKNRISKDPNNTTWSRSTERFGHKILTAQGWTPGSHLGAKNAPHTKHFTAASASHIRVILKDDNLGLGAKLNGANAETFGLNLLSGLLGRLNGKSDVELKEEASGQRDKQLALYQGQRWGHMNFIRGGYLIGDSIRKNLQENPEQERQNGEEISTCLKSNLVQTSSSKNLDSKKRKRLEVETDSLDRAKKTSRKTNGADNTLIIGNSSFTDAGVLAQAVNHSISEEMLRETPAEEHTSSLEQTSNLRPKKKTKKNRSEDSAMASDDPERKAERKRRKAEKKAKKEAKRLGRLQTSKGTSSSNQPCVSQDESPGQLRSCAKIDEPAKLQTSASPMPRFNVGRHAVRQRYIRQKQMASLDPQALKEIFMVKAQA